MEGEEIGVKNSAGESIESFTYLSTTPDISIERIDTHISASEQSNWKNGTPHSIGSLSAAQTPIELPQVEVAVQEAESIVEETNVATSTPAVITEIPQVINQSPFAVISIQSGQLTAYTNTTINFDGRESHDPDGDSLTYLWNFGDGEISTSANPGLHKFGSVGTYVVRLTVVDTQGAINTASTSVQVFSAEVAAPSPRNIEQTTITTTPTIITPVHTTQLVASINTRTEEEIVAAVQTNSMVAPFMSELLPSPKKNDGDEWIEIYNPNTTTFSLDGWLLADASKAKHPYKIPAGTLLQPHEFRVFYKKQTKISLNNDVDEIYFATPDGEVSDHVTYQSKKAGFSYIRRTTNPQSSWVWSATVTPNAENPQREEIRGIVLSKTSNNEEQSVNIKTVSGEEKKVTYSDEVLNADVAGAILKEGSEVYLDVLPQDNGEMELADITDIAPQIPQDDTKPQTQNTLLFTIVALACTASVVMNGIQMYHKKR